jgi:hypothetical protein
VKSDALLSGGKLDSYLQDYTASHLNNKARKISVIFRFPLLEAVTMTYIAFWNVTPNNFTEVSKERSAFIFMV